MANIWPWKKTQIDDFEDCGPEPLDEDEMIMDDRKPVQPKFIDDSKQRRYIIGHNYNKDTGEYFGFFVTDCWDDEELQAGTRPMVAKFPVSGLYDAHEQHRRAEQYAEYMNRLNDAKQKAYEQTLLVDIIKDQV